MQLSHLDFDALQRAIIELYEFRNIESFRGAAPRILTRLIPAAHFAWPEYSVDQATGCGQLVQRVELGGATPPELLGWAASNLVYHPFWKYFMRMASPSAVRMSDLLSLREFRDTMAYQEFYRIIGCNRELACLVSATLGPGPAAISFNRNGCDFTERDRLVLNLIRPHFNQSLHNAQLVTNWMSGLESPVALHQLTPRESEIATWLAQGKTNLEIAMILNARPRTIEKHVENILNKLGVENRTAAAVLIAQSAKPPRLPAP